MDKNKFTKLPKGKDKLAGISDKVIRLLDIYVLIARNAYPSKEFLCDKHEVSERTIYRDLDIINIIDNIELDREHGGYKFMNPDRLKKLSLSDDDFLLMLAMGEAVSHLGKPLLHNFENFTHNFLTAAKEAKSTCSVPIAIKMPYAIGCDKIEDLFKALPDCIKDQHSVDIVYEALYNKETTERRVDPYGLVYYEDAWHVYGYCHLREDMRMFALDRMRQFKPTQLRFQKPADFDLEKEFAGSWGVYNDDQTEVTVRFSKNVAEYITRKDKWHPSEKRTVLPNGDVELTFDVAGVKEIRRWIYSWIPNVEVIAPEWFREMVRKDADILQKIYKL